jgi:hypothetical protein
LGEYFTKHTDEAMVRFCQTTDIPERHRIFDQEIRPAFEKLIENLIYVYRFFKTDDVETLKKECLSAMYELIQKFDPTRGSKGFSYFNVVAKNWLIHKTRERNKRLKFESELYIDLDHESLKSDPNFIVAPHETDLEEREWWLKFYEQLESWRKDLNKKVELQVLESIIVMMKNPDIIPIFNKKAIYMYLREMTGLTTKQVVISLKKIKGLYLRWRLQYAENGESGGVIDLDDGYDEEDDGDEELIDELD